MRHLARGFLALALIAAAPALAQEGPYPFPLAQEEPPKEQPPKPALAQEEPPALVGRVSFVAGQLGFHTAGESEWSAAAVNYPVATSGSFWTDPQSRAEIRIGAQTIDLSNNTEVDVTQLNQQVMQIAVPQGRIALHLRSLPQGNTVEIDIPRGGVWLLQPGIYDIAAGSPERPARIMVFDGSARFVGGAVDIGIKAGEAAVIGGADTLTATIERAVPDAFVQWCRSRDYREQRLAAPYHVSPAMTGYEELDAYGSWRSAPDYGEVWYPNAVPAGWVPYRDGYWSWVEPWGWTWIALEPWGFAPFHYGRWAFIDGFWGWVPGTFVRYPVYAPALVAFLADPASILLTAAAAPLVGWFPLGPSEAYWPSYTTSLSYIRAVNTGVVSDPARLATRPTGAATTASRAFANRSATTVVPQHTFASTGRIAGAALPVSAPAVQNARVAAQSPAVQPTVARTGVATAGVGAAATTGAATGAATRGGAAAATTTPSTARGGSQLAAPRRGYHGTSAPSGARALARQFAAPSARASHLAGGQAGHRGASRAAAPGSVFHTGGGPHGGGPRSAGGGGPRGGGSHAGGGGPHKGNG